MQKDKTLEKKPRVCYAKTDKKDFKTIAKAFEIWRLSKNFLRATFFKESFTTP